MAVTIDGTQGITSLGSFYGQTTFTGTYTDGIVVDYTTGMGRISVGSSDGLTIYNGGLASTALVSVTSAGNVGIGTTSPLRKFQVTMAGSPEVVLQDTTQTADQKNWRLFTGNDFYIGTLNDAGSSGTDCVRIDRSANFKFNSGYGSVATAYGCRAWVNFNGTGTVAIRGSGNVSSITDNAVGLFTVNYSTALVDSNYAVSISMQPTGDPAYGISHIGPTGLSPANYSTTATTVRTAWSNAAQDPGIVVVATFR